MATDETYVVADTIYGVADIIKGVINIVHSVVDINCVADSLHGAAAMKLGLS